MHQLFFCVCVRQILGIVSIPSLEYEDNPLRVSEDLTCVQSNIGEGMQIDKGSMVCNDNDKPSRMS